VCSIEYVTTEIGHASCYLLFLRHKWCYFVKISNRVYSLLFWATLYVCDYDCVQLLHIIQHWTVPTIFPLIIQTTTTTTQTTSTGGEQEKRIENNRIRNWNAQVFYVHTIYYHPAPVQRLKCNRMHGNTPPSLLLLGKASRHVTWMMEYRCSGTLGEMMTILSHNALNAWDDKTLMQ